MRHVTKHRIFILLFLIGAFPAHIFTFRNFLGISQFPEATQVVATEKPATSIIPFYPGHVLTVKQPDHLITSPSVKYVNTAELTTGTTVALYFRVFLNS